MNDETQEANKIGVPVPIRCLVCHNEKGESSGYGGICNRCTAAAYEVVRLFVHKDSPDDCTDAGALMAWHRNEIDVLRQEIILLDAIALQAKLTLLVSINMPDDLQSSLGRLSLACRAHYEAYSTRVKAHMDHVSQQSMNSTPE